MKFLPLVRGIVFLLLVTSLIILVVFVVTQIPHSPVTLTANKLPRVGFVVDTHGCQIPDFDPFDDSLRHLVVKTYTIKCNATPPMTYVDKEWIRINHTALELFYTDQLDYCEYQSILRPTDSADPDNTYMYNKTAVQFKSDIKMISPFVRIVCYGKQGDMLYTNFHALILHKAQLEKIASTKFKTFVTHHSPKETLNVLVLGVDAVSRLNFNRQMPKTRRYILNTLKAAELKGFNKVADNTFVNLVPMFSGKFVEELPWDEMMSSIPFDNFSFLWNNFSQHGYRTLFAEDAPKITIFNYLKKGFQQQPADYYLRPFSLALEDHGSIWNTEHICVASKQETQVVLDYLLDFLVKFKDNPYFALTFITRLTHDVLNRAGVADDLYYEFFRLLHMKHYLKNTAIIFFSDHGIRFGPIRETYIGKLEERLPFAYIIMPDWFRQKYPELWSNTVVNQNRLTTPFDLFETMKDLLDFTGIKRTASVQTRGISLFSEIPTERTCEHAGILSHWCTCHQKQAVPLNDKIVVKAAELVIKSINQKLHEASPCAELKLKRVQDALMLVSNDHVLSFKDSLNDVIDRKVIFGERSEAMVDYLITFQVTPGDGLFEVTVRHSKLHEKYHINGEISRINRYGDQGYCIQSYVLQKFCYCP